MNTIEVMRLALDALTATMSTHGFQKHIDQAKEEAISALEQAIKQAEQTKGVSK
jgi:DTW domain-containing protein YfiP